MVSHLRLDGGKLSVQEENEITFMVEYATKVKMGIHQCLCEISTPMAPLYLDLDIKGPPVSMDDIKRVTYEITRILEKLEPHPHNCTLPDRDPRVNMCTSPLECHVCWSVRTNKTGVHMVYPGLIVEKSSMRRLVTYIIQQLNYSHIQTPRDDVKWEDVIDRAVYHKTGGLRMMGSYKAKQVSHTNGKKVKEADIEGGFYKYAFSMDEEGRCVTAHFETPDIPFFLMSVRHPSSFCKPNSIHSFEITYDKKRHWSGMVPNDGVPVELKKKRPDESATPIFSKDPRFHLIQDFIRLLPGYNHRTSIERMVQLDGSIIVYPDNKFCILAKKVHGTSTCYITFHEDGSFQRSCWSQKRPCCKKGHRGTYSANLVQKFFHSR